MVLLSEIITCVYRKVKKKVHLREIKNNNNNNNNNNNIRGTRRRFPIQSTFRSLSMNSKLRYKICIVRSVILGELESSKLQGSQSYFLENFRCNFKFYESENFTKNIS